MLFFRKIYTYSLRVLLAFLFFCFLLYGHTIGFEMTDLDDTILIKEDQSFIRNVSNIPKTFSQTVFYMRPDAKDIYYRPVLVSSFILDAQFSGSGFHAYHIANIIYHSLTGFLLFYFLSIIGFRNETSFLLSLVFLAYPAFATAVAWIPGRNDSLLAIFILSSFIYMYKCLHRFSVSNLFFHFLFFAFCLFTKETAVFIPVLFFFFLWIEKKKINKPKFLSFLLFSGWITLILIYEIFRKNALGDKMEPDSTGMVQLFFAHFPVILQYFGKLFFPFNLSTYPKMEDTTFWFGIAALGLFFVIMKNRIKGNPYFIFGACWLVLFLLPSAFITENALEHRLYVPAIGCCLLLASTKIFSEFDFEQGKTRWVAAGIILLFSLLAFSHSKNFRDADAFTLKARETSPHSAYVRQRMGIYYQLKGDFKMAESEYREAIALDSEIKGAHNNLGKILLDAGALAEAEKMFLKEIEIAPHNETAWYNLSSVSEKRSDYDAAKKHLEKAVELNPAYADALNDLGALHAMQKNYDAALRLCFLAIEAEPGYKLAYKNITLIYLAKKDLTKAKEYYKKSKTIGVSISLPVLDTLFQQ